MEIQLMTKTHELWDAVKEYTAWCGWSSGKILAEDMEKQRFQIGREWRCCKMRE